MKMELDSETEWGYYIDQENFKIYNIKDEIPDGSFVVIKEKEYIDDLNRTVIQTTYGIVDGQKYQPMNKKEISKLISEACASYILVKNKLPPKVSLEKEVIPDKPAKLAFVMNNYDTFHLVVDKDLLEGTNPAEIFNSLQEDVPELTEEKDPWRIEYAKSSRSTCKTCNKKIEKDTIRVGQPNYYEDHLNYRWNHENCIFWKRLSINNVDGLDELKEEDRKRIEKLLK